MSITKEQAMSYREVIEVLKYIPKEELNKIPKDIYNFYFDNMDLSYDFKIDVNKSFEEQVLLEKTKVVLAILFRDYWATPEQKEKIIKKEKYDIQLLEEKKKETYNTDIFANKQEQYTPEQSLVKYKEETWYGKFLKFIKNFFHIKK